MTKKTATDYSNLIARLEHRTELQSELAALKEELSEATIRHGAVTRGFPDAHSKIRGYKGDPKRYGAQLSQAREELCALRKEDEELERTIGELKSRRAEIEQALSESAKEGTTAEVVQAHFKALEEVRARAERLDTLIAEGQEKMGEAKELDSPMTALGLERQDLLADIAMGKAKESDLEAWDARSAEKQSKIDHDLAAREQVVDRAGQTLAGLQRRATEARAEVERLEVLASGVLGQYLMTRMAHVAGEYLEQATKTADTLKRLAALDQLIARQVPQQGGSGFLPSSIHRLFLPSLRPVEDVGKLSADPEPLLVFADLERGNSDAAALAAEVSMIAAEGVPGIAGGAYTNGR